MSDLDVLAIRTGVAWSTEPPVVALRLTGDDAFNVLDRVCPTDLFVRDGQVRPSVLLDEQARIFADVYVGSDDDGYLLLSEGPTAEHLTEHLKTHAPAGAKLVIEDMTAAHDILSIHGPYAWELIGELLGPDLIGLPYLYFYRAEEVFCLRAGKTGEYGYDLLVPGARTPDLVARLEDVGRAFDLRRVGLVALEQCALENGFFNVRREGARGLTPIDLGVQWRVSYRKEYVGSAALSALRNEGWARRATTVLAEQPLSAGDAVFLDGDRIGEVLTAGESTLVKAHVGLALIDKPFGHAGIDRFTAAATAGDSARRVALTTVSPPVVDNRSLYINPQRHAYATRARDIFPPIA
jgi:glycine cleavage system aminomethyltransferase T